MSDTPTTEVAVSDQHVSFMPDATESQRIWDLAKTIASTEFVPGDLRGKPQAILAAMLTGREIGIGPMHSLRAIDVIDGRPSLSPELMASLVLRQGHDLYPEESTAERCVMAGRRVGWPDDRVVRVEWTIDDAKLAGLVDPGCSPAEGTHPQHEVRRRRRGEWVTEQGCDCRQGWRTYPRALLRARSTGELCRAIFPDVVERVGYTAEEMGGTPVGHATAVDVVRDIAPETADVVDATFDDDDPPASDVQAAARLEETLGATPIPDAAGINTEREST